MFTLNWITFYNNPLKYYLWSHWYIFLQIQESLPSEYQWTLIKTIVKKQSLWSVHHSKTCKRTTTTRRNRTMLASLFYEKLNCKRNDFHSDVLKPLLMPHWQTDMACMTWQNIILHSRIIFTLQKQCDTITVLNSTTGWRIKALSILIRDISYFFCPKLQYCNFRRNVLSNPFFLLITIQARVSTGN